MKVAPKIAALANKLNDEDDHTGMLTPIACMNIARINDLINPHLLEHADHNRQEGMAVIPTTVQITEGSK
jgi:hypothetical protein